MKLTIADLFSALRSERTNDPAGGTKALKSSFLAESPSSNEVKVSVIFSCQSNINHKQRRGILTGATSARIVTPVTRLKYPTFRAFCVAESKTVTRSFESESMV